MFSPTPPVDQLVTCDFCIYVLKDAKSDRIRLACGSLEASGRKSYLFTDVDFEGSSALLFTKPFTGLVTPVQAFTKVSVDHRMGPKDEKGRVWFGPAAVSAFMAYVGENFGAPRFVLPLSELYPDTADSAETLRQAMRNRKAREVLVCKDPAIPPTGSVRAGAGEGHWRREGVQPRAATAADRVRKGEFDCAVNELAKSGTYIRKDMPIASALPRLAPLLTQLNKVCSGFMSFNKERTALEFWVQRQNELVCCSIAAALHEWVVVDFDPLSGPPEKEVPIVPIFGEKVVTSQRGKGGAALYRIPCDGAFTALTLGSLATLGLGIRGLDLAIDARSLTFDPNHPSRFAQGSPERPLSAWAQMWALAKVKPSKEMLRYLRQREAAEFIPPSMRFLPAVHSARGVEEFVILLRDAQDVPCGVHLVPIDGQPAQTVFGDPAASGYGRPFLAKKRVAVASNFDDMLALRRQLNLPIWLAPKPAALAMLPLSPDCEILDVCVFSAATVTEEWVDAMRELDARCKPAGVRLRALYPRVSASAKASSMELASAIRVGRSVNLLTQPDLEDVWADVDSEERAH